MKAQVAELLTLISSGSMAEEDIQRIAGEAAQAYADPQAFLASHADSGYDASLPISPGEWMLVSKLPDNVLFQAKQVDELYQQLAASFGSESALALDDAQLADSEPLQALRQIQLELSSLYPETDGYELIDFGEPLDSELQMALIYTRDLPRVQALAAEIGIYAAPAYESRLSEQGDGEDG